MIARAYEVLSDEDQKRAYDIKTKSGYGYSSRGYEYSYDDDYDSYDGWEWWNKRG